MSDYEIKWSQRSIDDFNRLKNFLKPKNPTAARKAVQRIKHAVYFLATSPDMGVTLSPDDDRQELYPDFGKDGYVIRYKSYEEQRIVRILRIWHSKEER